MVPILTPGKRCFGGSLVVAMLVPTVYFTVKYTVLFYNQPTTTAIRIEGVNYEEFDKLLVCLDNWAVPGERLSEFGLAYMSGFLVNTKLASYSKPESAYQQIWQDEAALDKARTEFNRLFSGANGSNVISAISRIKYVVARDTGSRFSVEPMELKPHYQFGSSACGYVHPVRTMEKRGLLYRENTRGAIEDNPQFWFVTARKDMYTGIGAIQVNVGLFNTKQFPFLRIEKDLVPYTYDLMRDDFLGAGPWNGEGSKLSTSSPPEGNSGNITATPVPSSGRVVLGKRQKRQKTVGSAKDPIIEQVDVQLLLDIQKRTSLKTRNADCKKGHGIHPVGFLERVCLIDCEEEAYRQVFGCSTYSYFGYEGLWEKPHDLPPCHIYDPKLPGKVPAFATRNFTILASSLDSESQVLMQAEACARKRKCKGQRYCAEYETPARYTVSETRVVPDKGGFVDPNEETLHMVSVLFPTKVVVSEEQLQIDLEDWVGTIGGIIGIYMGWSVMTALETMIAFWKEKKGKRKARGNG